MFKRERFTNEEEVRNVIFLPENGKCKLSTINGGSTVLFKFGSGTSINKFFIVLVMNKKKKWRCVRNVYFIDSKHLNK